MWVGCCQSARVRSHFTALSRPMSVNSSLAGNIRENLTPHGGNNVTQRHPRQPRQASADMASCSERVDLKLRETRFMSQASCWRYKALLTLC